MDPLAPPQLYNLVLGLTVALLRERRGFQQNSLAEQVALTKAKMSRIEKGQTPVDTLLLQKLAGALETRPEALMDFANLGVRRTQEAARQMLPLPDKDWWEALHHRAGEAGSVGLATFAVSLVLRDT